MKFTGTADYNHAMLLNKSVFSAVMEYRFVINKPIRLRAEKNVEMVLQISQNRTLKETQDDFNSAYPYLRIEFYRNTEPGFARRHLKNTMPMTAAGLKQNGEIEINDLMTVGQLENTFRSQFGLQVQVSRRSGTLWLETTMTDNWTLKQQNDHGRELSEPVPVKTGRLPDIDLG